MHDSLHNILRVLIGFTQPKTTLHRVDFGRGLNQTVQTGCQHLQVASRHLGVLWEGIVCFGTRMSTLVTPQEELHADLDRAHALSSHLEDHLLGKVEHEFHLGILHCTLLLLVGKIKVEIEKELSSPQARVSLNYRGCDRRVAPKLLLSF